MIRGKSFKLFISFFVVATVALFITGCTGYGPYGGESSTANIEHKQAD